MKKNVVLLFAAAALWSCNGPNYTLTGRVDLPPGDSVFLIGSAGGDDTGGDHAEYAGGDFPAGCTQLAAGIVAPDSTLRLRGRVAEPMIAWLVDQDGVTEGPAHFFLEPGEIRMEFADDMRAIVAAGTPLNNLKLAFDERMAAFDREFRALPFGAPADSLWAAYEKLVPETVGANTDNLFGAWVFATHQLDSYDLTTPSGLAIVKSRLGQFTPRMRAHPLLKRIAERIAAIENTETGKPFIDLALPDTKESPVALSTLTGNGRWVLVEFWATWCAPCRAELPNLRDAYAAYREKGFGIYAVSLDNDTEKWRAFVSKNNLPWINVSGVGADKQSAAATRYGIASIPSNFLISPEGHIAAKNLRGGELKEKLEEVMP